MDYTLNRCLCKSGFTENGGQALCLECSTFTTGCSNCTSVGCNECDTSRNFLLNPNAGGMCACTAFSSLDSATNSCVCNPKSYGSGGFCYSCAETCLSCNISSTNCLDCYPNVYRVKTGSYCSCDNQFMGLCTTSNITCNASACYFNNSIGVSISLE